MGWVNQRNLRLIKLREYDIMKQLLVLAGFALLLSSLAGCQKANKGVDPAPPRGGVEVIIEGNGEFPEFLVGRWKADKDGWQFVFEPDGRISSAVIALGGVEMTPGKVTRFPTLYGGKGIYKPGTWLVQYSPNTRELFVKVVIEHFYQDLGKHAIEGNITDMFIGPVWQNDDVWEADWFSLGKYVAYIPEPNEFYNATEPEFRKSLIFEKVKHE